MSVSPKTIVFFHPDLGIGGAERLVIDAAVGLKTLGHEVVIFTSHCDPRHCFDEARDGTAFLLSLCTRSPHTNILLEGVRYARCASSWQLAHSCHCARPFQNPLCHPSSTAPPLCHLVEWRTTAPTARCVFLGSIVVCHTASEVAFRRCQDIILLPLPGSTTCSRSTEIVETNMALSLRLA